MNLNSFVGAESGQPFLPESSSVSSETRPAPLPLEAIRGAALAEAAEHVPQVSVQSEFPKIELLVCSCGLEATLDKPWKELWSDHICSLPGGDWQERRDAELLTKREKELGQLYATSLKAAMEDSERLARGVAIEQAAQHNYFYYEPEKNQWTCACGEKIVGYVVPLESRRNLTSLNTEVDFVRGHHRDHIRSLSPDAAQALAHHNATVFHDTLDELKHDGSELVVGGKESVRIFSEEALAAHDAEQVQAGKDWEYRHHHDPDHECCVNCQLERIAHDAEIERRARLPLETVIEAIRKLSNYSGIGYDGEKLRQIHTIIAALAESQPAPAKEGEK